MGCRGGAGQCSGALGLLGSGSDGHLSSPCRIGLESGIGVAGVGEVVANCCGALDCCTGSPCRLLGICAGRSVESVHTDARVWGVKCVCTRGPWPNRVELGEI